MKNCFVLEQNVQNMNPTPDHQVLLHWSRGSSLLLKQVRTSLEQLWSYHKHLGNNSILFDSRFMFKGGQSLEKLAVEANLNQVIQAPFFLSDNSHHSETMPQITHMAGLKVFVPRSIYSQVIIYIGYSQFSFDILYRGWKFHRPMV